MAIPTTLPIKYKCGHTEKRDLSDVPAGKRKSRVRFYGQKFDCKKCFKATKAATNEAEANQRAIDAEAFSATHELPELEGSEKQIKWGMILRFETVAAVVDADELDHDAAEVLDAARSIRYAGWWLDTLNWQDQKDHDYGPSDFAELILTGPAAQAERDETHVETENPF